MDQEQKGPPTFSEELRQLLNRHCKGNGSNTPDFILADFLLRSLESFDKAVLQLTKRW